MKMPWHVRRAVMARGDGERRWDYAYQFLLQWAMEHEAGTGPAPSHQEKEEHHGRGFVCPGFDHPATAVADD